MKYTLYIFIFFTITTNFALAGFLDVRAVEESGDFKVGDEILFEVKLDTQEEFYNATHGILVVDDIFEIKQIITGGSIISAWIENPANSKNNQIEFTGIIAGGFKGSEKVFRFIGIPRNEGLASVTITNASIFLNDGLGTEKVLPNKNLSLNIRNLESGEENTRITMKDTVEPERFEVILTKDSNIEDGKYVLIFEAIDKGSGIRSYEVLEGKKVFTQAKSPYVLVNQRLNERIYVKAIDYDGNERVVRVEIPGKVCVGIKCVDQKITILVLVIGFILSFILWRKQSKEFERISETVS